MKYSTRALTNSIATGVSRVNIRLLLFSTSDNIRFSHCSLTWAQCFYYQYLTNCDHPSWIRNTEKHCLNGKVSYLCVTYMLFLFPTLWKELLQFRTITKHTWEWEIDKNHESNSAQSTSYLLTKYQTSEISLKTANLMLKHQKWQHCSCTQLQKSQK